MGASPARPHGDEVVKPLQIERETLDGLRFSSRVGGLAIMGPTSKPMPGICALLESPSVVPIEMPAADLMTWKTASAAVMTATRRVSRALRDGRTAVVYLDIHVGTAAPVAVADHDFICDRLSRIMLGLADEPPYITLHGQQLAKTILADSSGVHSPTLGVIGDGLPVARLAESSMFAGTPVAFCSSDRPATAAIQALDWFEARRV